MSRAILRGPFSRVIIAMCNPGRMMPTKHKRTTAPGRARAPKGKKQMLVIMDQDLIKDVKMAALEDDMKMSHAVEQAVREWLSRRKSRKGA